MIIQTEDYKIICDKNNIALSGELRLPSPTEYEEPFQPIKNMLETGSDKTNFSINLSDLTFLNSSGITALARLIILARKKNIKMVLVIKENIPWQKKTISSLKNLWDKVEIEAI